MEAMILNEYSEGALCTKTDVEKPKAMPGQVVLRIAVTSAASALATPQATRLNCSQQTRPILQTIEAQSVPNVLTGNKNLD